MNVDSKFSYKLVSRPFKGRRIDTPGADAAGAEERGERGRSLYRLRLHRGVEFYEKKLQLVRLETHAVQQPSIQIDHIAKYQTRPSAARTVSITSDQLVVRDMVHEIHEGLKKKLVYIK